ncbi:thiamine pyrophosphate-dependent enzyme [Candidatus Magnetominusculus xianensis]|uniref:2-oxoglutarate oxidoreductase subunit KorB n=1 Tax=Candidatus Magnetominusculus xianensis TaxID=1748249 RepID=A0ABR5SH51_9BACT|nr:thiamine pyrophosphate-dependent enzyme [Candidatus Magnetominusculus xianensis]KWT86780.1 2-oxoglutarate oxidoreductase subunit KorB [Candidatus Magnetominusculus xianensis]MBF0402502.1 2-oxoglutarate oxidoreductase [Nitrospirota bacterium]
MLIKTLITLIYLKLHCRIIAETIDELKIRERAIGIAPVGCAVFAYDYFNFDLIECAHGRPPAVATALKRIHPNSIVFSYQGDGDLAAIGTAEIIHAANRGENLSIFFINNATYGMTGGQMAPTTLLNQQTTTSPRGKKATVEGYPLKVAELISSIDGAVFVARTSLDTVKNLMETKKLVKKVFENQINCRGFSFLEILSPCPTDWHIEPEDSLKWIQTDMIKVYKTGILKS